MQPTKYSFRKKNQDKGLRYTETYLIDRSELSSNYFNLSDIQTEFCAGKNIIKLGGNNNYLTNGSEIQIEIIDYSGNVVYNDVSDYIDRSGRRYITIYVTPEISSGECLITVLGEASFDVITIPGSTLNIPEYWLNKPNIKWQKVINIDSSKRNNNEIVLDLVNPPIISVEEKFKTFPIYNNDFITGNLSNPIKYVLPEKSIVKSPNYDRYEQLFVPSEFKETFTTSSYLSVKRETTYVDNVDRAGTNTSNEYTVRGLTSTFGFSVDKDIFKDAPIITSTTAIFSHNTDWMGAEVVFRSSSFSPLPTPPNGTNFVDIYENPDNYEYKSRIKYVINPYTAVLTNPFKRIISGPLLKDALQNYYIPTFNANNLEYTAKYKGYNVARYVESNIYKNYAHIKFENVKPLSGDVYKVKTYVKNYSGMTDYELISEDIVQQQNLLIKTGSLEFNNEIGDFVKNNITNWNQSYVNPVDYISLNMDSDDVSYASLKINGSISNNIGYALIYPYVENKKLETKFYFDNNYEISLSVRGVKLPTNPRNNIKFYISGSAFDDIGDPFGRQIGSIDLQQNTIDIVGLHLNVIPDHQGDGVLLIKYEGGTWYLRDIKLNSLKEPGTSPQTFTINTQVPITYDNEYLDFKFELYDYMGNMCDDVLYVNQVKFTHGKATYISGNYNVMTGSMSITGSINMTGSFLLNGTNISDITGSSSISSSYSVTSSYAVSASWAPGGGSSTLQSTYVGVGNVSNEVSGSTSLTFDTNSLSINTPSTTDANLNIKGKGNVGTTNLVKMYDSVDNELGTFTDEGNLILNNLSGSNNRVVEVSSSGLFSATKELVEWVVDVGNTAIATGSWIGNTFEYPGIEGQWGMAGNYEYRCVSSLGLWTRYPTNKEYQDVFISDIEVISSLTNDTSWSFSNNYLETSSSVLNKIYNGQHFLTPFYDYKYFVYDITGKKILREKINENIYTEITNITGSGTLGKIVPSGYKISSLVLNEITGSVNVTVNIGLSLTGSEVMNNGVIPSDSFLNCNMTQSLFSLYFDQELFISSSNWGGATINAYVKTERVM